MHKKIRGRGLVGIMIALAFFVLLFRISLEQIIKMNIAQNQSLAQETLKTISLAIENYAKDHQGVFPAEFSQLTKGQPAYLDQDYLAQSNLKGYNYSCTRLETSGYSCAALPEKCSLTGRIIYTISNGGLITTDECNKKEKE